MLSLDEAPKSKIQNNQLLPLCSNVLPQKATQQMRNVIVKENVVNEGKRGRLNSDDEWSVESDSMDDIHSLDQEYTKESKNHKRKVAEARHALFSEHLHDVADQELLPSPSQMSSTEFTSSSSSSPTGKPRRNNEERSKRKNVLASINAKKALRESDATSSSSRYDPEPEQSLSSSTSSDFNYYKRPTNTRIPKYSSRNVSSKVGRRPVDASSVSVSSDNSSYRSYKLPHYDYEDAGDDLSSKASAETKEIDSYVDSDVSIDFSISSAGSSAQGMARAPVPLLSVSGRSSHRPRWKP